MEKNGVRVEYLDVDTVDGMGEAAFYEVVSTPTVVVVDENGTEVVSWRGKVPNAEVVMKLLGRN